MRKMYVRVMALVLALSGGLIGNVLRPERADGVHHVECLIRKCCVSV